MSFVKAIMKMDFCSEIHEFEALKTARRKLKGSCGCLVKNSPGQLLSGHEHLGLMRFSPACSSSVPGLEVLDHWCVTSLAWFQFHMS